MIHWDIVATGLVLALALGGTALLAQWLYDRWDHWLWLRHCREEERNSELLKQRRVNKP